MTTRPSVCQGRGVPAAALLLALILLLGAGATAEEAGVPQGGQAETQGTAHAGRPGDVAAEAPGESLVIGMSTSILLTLDPAEAYEVEALVLIDQLYDKLVELAPADGRIEVVPEVADSWSVAPDGRTWTFHIREGIHFASGRAVTAHDAAFSLRRAVAVDGGPAWLLNSLGLFPETVDGRVRALDERTLEISLSEPFAPSLVLSILAFPVTSIVDREFIEASRAGGEGEASALGEGRGGEVRPANERTASPLRNASAGTGPYRLVRWEPGEYVALEANAAYWRGAPPVRDLLVRDLPDDAAQAEALRRRLIDVAWNLSPQIRRELAALHPEELRVVQVPAHGVQYLAMNASSGPLADERVRSAVRWAIDYDAIVSDVLLGEALPLQSFIPAGYLGHDPATPFARDVDKATELLASAGYAGGFEVELAVDEAGDAVRAIAELVQANLAGVGIRVRIAPMPAGELFQRFRQREHQMVIARWGVDYPDPAAVAAPFADGSVQQLAWRNGWYDERATQLAAAAMLEQDPEARAALYRELNDLLQRRGPFAILHQPLNAWVVTSDVEGFEEAAALGTMHFDLTKVRKTG